MSKNTNKKVVFIADFFADQISGGGELNNEELYRLLTSKGFVVEKINSHNVTLDFLSVNKESYFLVFNYVNLGDACKEYLKSLRYSVYEHDHKYLPSRNPALYKDFSAPPSDIRNHQFYTNAENVFCQSKMHKEIILKNLDLENVVNLGGNLWADQSLDNLRLISRKDKQKSCAVMNSTTGHKNTRGAVDYCIKNNLNHELVGPLKPLEFHEALGRHNTFVFLPRTPETLSRVVVEARMMGMSVITNSLVGATSEDWFTLKGEALIDFMQNKKDEILSIIIDTISPDTEQKVRPTVSILSTFYHGEKFLDHFLQDITQQSIFDKCELILIDTNSPGNERQIVEKYLKDFKNIRYYRYDERVGPTEGTNMALKKARGEYLTIANIDDRRHPRFLENNLEHLRSNSNASLVYSQCYVTSIPNQKFEQKPGQYTLFDHSTLPFKKSNMIKCLPGPMPLWKSIVNDKCGLFDENYSYANDWEMWLRSVEHGFTFIKNDEVLGSYLEGGRSQDAHNLPQRQEEARLFYKYSNIFGNNFLAYKQYFDQFI